MSPIKHALQENLNTLAQRDGNTPVGCVKWAKANWEKITKYPWVLGVQDEVLVQSHSDSPSCSSKFTTEANTINNHRDSELNAEKCCNNINKHKFSIQNISGPPKRWVSRTSNQFMPSQPFFGLGAFQNGERTSIKHLIQEGNWIVKLDLKDAYFVVPIH